MSSTPDHPTPSAPGWSPDRYADWVRLAVAEARAVGTSGDVPVGALVVGPDGAVLGRGRNVRERDHDPTGHAEVVALREAGRALGTWRLEGCSLVVTLEPCAMCAGAMVLARLPALVYGADDPKAGAAGSVFDLVRDPRLNHRVQVTSGVLADECGQLLTRFFRARRARSRRTDGVGTLPAASTVESHRPA